MADIPRKTAQIFAVNQQGAPANQLAKFGSAAIGAQVFSSDLDIIQSAEYLAGWTAAVVNQSGGTTQPELEDRNAVDYTFSTQITYLMQKGIPEWDDDTDYYALKSWCTFGGVIYRAKADNTNQQPDTSPGQWDTLASLLIPITPAAYKAWIVFNGATMVTMQSFNVQSIVRNSAGNYTITLTTPTGNVALGLGGNCSGIVRPIAQDASHFTFDTAQLAGGVFSPFDYPYVSISIFGN